MKHTKTSLAIAAVLAAGTQFSGAVPSIKIMSGTDTILVIDNLAGDLSPQSDSILTTAIGIGGLWQVVVTYGAVIPNPGLVGEFLHFGLNATALPNAGPLTILFSNDEGVTLPSPFTAQIGGSLSAQSSLVVENWYGGRLFDTNNSQAALATSFSFVNNSSQSATLASLGATSDSGAWTTPTWTAKAVLTPGPNGGTTSFDESKVPDGGTTLALLGGSLLGLGAIRRKLVKA